VDAAKCLAIMIVLFNHIGLIIPGISSFGGMFYVPIFFVLAGYTYHSGQERYPGFAGKKARRLLIPYAVANLVYFMIFFLKDLVTGGIGKDTFEPLIGIFYSRYSLYPPYPELDRQNRFFLTIQNSPTWFLTALFLSYLVFELVMRFVWRRSPKCRETVWILIGALPCLFVGVVMHYICPVLLPWSLECIWLFAVYLFAGYLFRRLELCRRVWESKGILPYLSVLMLGLMVWLGYIFGGSANISIGNFGNYVVLGVLNGITSSLLVLLVCYRLDKVIPKVISTVGRHTLHILCYHLLVFLILETGCNTLLPGRLQGQDPVAMMLRLIVVIVTVAVIVAADTKVLPCLASIRKVRPERRNRP